MLFAYMIPAPGTRDLRPSHIEDEASMEMKSPTDKTLRTRDELIPAG